MADDPWKDKLTSEQYRLLRQNGTEPPYSGKLLHNKKQVIIPVVRAAR